MGKVELGLTPASQNQDMGKKETAVFVGAFTLGLLSQTPNTAPANGESLEAQENERNTVALPGDPHEANRLSREQQQGDIIPAPLRCGHIVKGTKKQSNGPLRTEGGPVRGPRQPQHLRLRAGLAALAHGVMETAAGGGLRATPQVSFGHSHVSFGQRQALADLSKHRH